MLLCTKNHHQRRSIDEPIALANMRESASAAGLGAHSSGLVTSTWRLGLFANNRTPGPEDTVVYIDGTFDLFHVGHLRVLKKAKVLGTFLYVGLHDDKLVNERKGRNYPIMSLYERAMNVLACDLVDDVILGAPWVVTDKLLDTLGVHKVVVGSLHDTAYNTSEVYASAQKRGIYHVVESASELTTDELIQRIVKNRLVYEKRQAKKRVIQEDQDIV